jgi:hypothetical protein
MNKQATSIAASIFQAADPVINIRALGGGRWVRGVPETDDRYGPWLPADYEIVNEEAWRRSGACLYLVGASDSNIRYVGMSRNRLQDRWRTSPAYDAENPQQKLPRKQLFHSQCWKHIEAESAANPGTWFQVRTIAEERLVPLLEEIGPPVSSLPESRADSKSVVERVESWLCSHSSNELAPWNVTGTGSGTGTPKG